MGILLDGEGKVLYTHIHMKRTSLNIEDSLIEQIAKEAQRQNVTQTELIKLILVQGLNALKIKRKARRLDIPVMKGTGLKPGIDLSNRAALIDLLDEKKI